jgi:hypothetical protein
LKFPESILHFATTKHCNADTKHFNARAKHFNFGTKRFSADIKHFNEMPFLGWNISICIKNWLIKAFYLILGQSENDAVW